jgi:hypothetical protein
MPEPSESVLGEIYRKLARMERLLLLLLGISETEMTDLSNLQTQVAANTTVIQSAETLISGLATQLAAAIAAQQNGDDGAALQALQQQLSTDDAGLAAAVAANTPAAPPASTTTSSAT